MNSYVEDEDVLQLLTGDDEFDADIDEDAEEELLRDDMNEHQMGAIGGSGDGVRDGLNHNNSFINQSIDDEEEDEDRDSGRERFKSERIMSLASVPTRRREIPDSLDSVKVNLNDIKTDNKNNYNNNRKHNQKFRQNNNNNNNNYNNSGIDYKRSNHLRPNQALLPLPTVNNLIPQHIRHQTQQQRMLLIQPNIYGQQFQPQLNINNNINNNSSVHNIHVNPHFRARPSSQFEQLSQAFRPQESVRMPNMLIQTQRQQYPPQQNAINSQHMLINQQIRPHFVANNMLYNDQNRPQLQHQPQQQQQQQQQQTPLHIPMEQQWRNQSPIQAFPPHQQLGQQLIPQQLLSQQMPIERSMNGQPIQTMFNGPQQQPYPNNSFNPNFQPNNSGFMAPNAGQHSIQMQNNNYNNQYPIEAQRFPIQSNYNSMQFQNQPHFQPQHNQQILSNVNINPLIHQQIRPEVGHQRPMKSNVQQKRTNNQSQQGLRNNKPLLGSNDQQKTDALKLAQMKTKRAKQLLTKKTQNVKEVPLVKSSVVSSVNPKVNAIVEKVNAEMEASVGVDDEYKKKMEEQKRLREEILRKKEERRKAMAAQRLRESGTKTALQTNKVVSNPRVSPIKSQPQQQIATLLNRSPQIQQRLQTKATQKRIVKPISNETIGTNATIKLVNPKANPKANQKRSVLIKGLASSTTEMTIKKLCKPIGLIESCKIAINGGQKNATVTFIRSQDAIAFQSKYERTLLDLSIIQVSLIWFVVKCFFNNYSNNDYICL